MVRSSYCTEYKVVDHQKYLYSILAMHTKLNEAGLLLLLTIMKTFYSRLLVLLTTLGTLFLGPELSTQKFEQDHLQWLLGRVIQGNRQASPESRPRFVSRSNSKLSPSSFVIALFT
jgi:hypothetical protein